VSPDFPKHCTSDAIVMLAKTFIQNTRFW